MAMAPPLGFTLLIGILSALTQYVAWLANLEATLVSGAAKHKDVFNVSLNSRFVDLVDIDVRSRESSFLESLWDRHSRANTHHCWRNARHRGGLESCKDWQAHSLGCRPLGHEHRCSAVAHLRGQVYRQKGTGCHVLCS